MISTRVHGILDYALGVLLVASPWLFGLDPGGPSGLVPMALGAAVLLYSALTDYELGLVRRIQMTVHLWLDALGGVLIAASPWLLGFDQRVWVPHVVFGVLEIGVAVLSNTIPSYERRRAR